MASICRDRTFTFLWHVRCRLVALSTLASIAQFESFTGCKGGPLGDLSKWSEDCNHTRFLSDWPRYYYVRSRDTHLLREKPSHFFHELYGESRLARAV